MKLIVLITIIAAFSGVCFDHAQAQNVSSPMDIQFKRQAVHRLVFDHENAIPLSMLKPSKIVKLSIEHPSIKVSGGTTSYKVDKGLLTVSAGEPSESALWVGGFNPYGTYDVSFAASEGNSGEAGVEFATPDNKNRLVILAGFNENECTTIHWRLIVDGIEKQNDIVTLKKAVKGPFILRVQVIGTKLNVFVEQNGVSRAVNVRDFMQFIDLRRKDYIRSFEFRLLTKLDAGGSVVIKEAGASLTTGAGQADICAITYKDGSPFLDQGRLWFTMTIRGRHFPQGVFSMDPSVFDVRLEGVIAFDRNDGLLRNELGSHIYYDKEAKEWRGLTVGMSAYYDIDKKIGKQLWAISSKKDPRFGFSIMKAKPVILPNSSEDPHIIYDQEAGKWRVLACAKGGAGFPATLYESDRWDGPYKVIAGPVNVNSTGCLLQKFGSKYYALFGSHDRKFYVYSYPDLKQLGALDMFRPPWDDSINTRCWPNVIPLPDGYPAPYISLTMDRVNYPGLGSHIYGALYLYHGYPKNGDRDKMGAQGLPRVLVVGDSISMNYHEAARAALEGIAHYERIEGNGGPSDRGVAQIAQWLGPYTQAGRQWDVIQFNHGLHDLKQSYDKTNDTWGAHQVAIEVYKEHLEREIAMMKRTGATLIWCTTTPVPNSNQGKYARRRDEDLVYNRAAMEVMRRHPEIQINDLNRVVRESAVFDTWRQGNDVHFKGEEQAVLGRAVADAVIKALNSRQAAERK